MKCETDTATIDYEAHGKGRPILFLARLDDESPAGDRVCGSASMG
jgi:hypothetical protein